MWFLYKIKSSNFTFLPLYKILINILERYHELKFGYQNVKETTSNYEYREQTTTFVPAIKKNRTEIEETTVNNAILIGVSFFVVVVAVVVAVVYFSMYYKKSTPNISSVESLPNSMTTTTNHSLYTMSFEEDETKFWCHLIRWDKMSFFKYKGRKQFFLNRIIFSNFCTYIVYKNKWQHL